MRSANSRTGMLDRTKLLHVLSKCANLAACTRSERDQGSGIIHAQSLLFYRPFVAVRFRVWNWKGLHIPPLGIFFLSFAWNLNIENYIHCSLYLKIQPDPSSRYFIPNCLNPARIHLSGGFLSFLHPGYQQYFIQYLTAAIRDIPHSDTCTSWVHPGAYHGSVGKSLVGTRCPHAGVCPTGSRTGAGRTYPPLAWEPRGGQAEHARQRVWKDENCWLTASDQN